MLLILTDTIQYTYTYRNRVGFWAGVVLLALLWVGLGQAVAQKKAKDEEKMAVPGTTTLSKAAEEAQFTDGIRFLMTDEPTKAITQFEDLLKKDPNSAATHYTIGSTLLKMGKTAEALRYAQRAYQLDNTNKFYTLLLAEVHVKQKHYADAEVLYESLLKKGGDNLEYGIELAAIYLFDDKPEKALDTYEKVEKSLGMNEEITRQKQRIYLKQNKIDKAIGEAEKLINSEPSDPDYLIEGAELLIANDRAPQAIGWLDRALKLAPDSPQAHVLLAEIYSKQGNLEKSGQELKFVFANPNLEASVKARILMSYVSMAGDNAVAKQDALRLARELVKAHPAEPKAQVMLADLFVQQNLKVEARDAYARATRLDPSVFEVWGAVLQLDGELNQVDSLLAHSEKALEVFPNQGLFWYSNGSAQLFKRHYQQAVEALEESKKLLGNDLTMTRHIHAQLGDAYNGIKEYAKSDEAYELALKDEPTNDHVLNNYSYFLSLRKEKLERARQLSENLIARNPDNGTYLDTYAWVLYVSKEYVKARQYLEKAVQADPNGVSGTIIEHYGDVLFQLGERDKAI